MNDNVKKTLKRILCGSAAVMAVAGAFVLGYFTKVWNTPHAMREIEFVLNTIYKNYDGEFSETEFIENAVYGSLDPYCAYYAPADYDNVLLQREGINRGRLGISFSGVTNRISVVSGNSPAERAGITVGGRVVGVKLLSEEEYTEVSDYAGFSAFTEIIEKDVPINLKILYGEEFSEFTVSKGDFVEAYVWYADSEESYNMSLDGDEWKAVKREKTVKEGVREGYAYIKLSSFNAAAATQLKIALSIMKGKGITKLVLDLRGNGGGYMNVLEDVAGLLTPGRGKRTVAVAKYKSGGTYEFFTSGKEYADYNFTKIAVLCNAGTASASEALIGAVLDYDAFENKNIAEVYVSKYTEGVYRTYGKGIMQTTFTSGSGSAVKLTTAHIYWPKSNTLIHGQGITPDTDERVHGVDPVTGEDAELLAAMN